jgi:hypothetical protein
VPPHKTRKLLLLTGAKADARCLLIHADASLSLSRPYTEYSSETDEETGERHVYASFYRTRITGGVVWEFELGQGTPTAIEAPHSSHNIFLY